MSRSSCAFMRQPGLVRSRRAANRLSPNCQDYLPLATLRAIALLFFLARLQIIPRPLSVFGPAGSRRREGQGRGRYGARLLTTSPEAALCLLEPSRSRVEQVSHHAGRQRAATCAQASPRCGLALSWDHAQVSRTERGGRVGHIMIRGAFLRELGSLLWRSWARNPASGRRGVPGLAHGRGARSSGRVA